MISEKRTAFSHTAHCFAVVQNLLVEKYSKPQHTYTKRNQMLKR